MNKNYFFPADILMPKENFSKWSVIACDQYTSQIDYWNEVKDYVGDSFSTYNITLPEVYLDGDNDSKIKKINKNMQSYLKSNVFNCYENTMVYIERKLKSGKIRYGLLGLIDLEDYSYEKGANTAIRATEETVIDRIPPRVNIRKDASLELPHIMLLIDDVNDSVIGAAKNNTHSFEKLYDFTLMQNAGSIKGYSLTDDTVVKVQNALNDLMDKSSDGLLFAVGDGNHSLASAKECYKQGIGPRYALVEIVNIHDSSLHFEPIYRVLFGVDAKEVVKEFIAYCGGEYEGANAQKFKCVTKDETINISVKPKGTLCIATLQSFLDTYIKHNKDIKLDYIHGIDSVNELCKSDNTLGFIFDGMEKSELFEAVAKDGSLPRKTFSMGCADDKRFYLEARKIK